MLGSAIIRKYRHWLILATTVLFLLVWHFTSQKSQPTWIYWRPNPPSSNDKAVTAFFTSARTVAVATPGNTTNVVNTPAPTTITSLSSTLYSQTLATSKLHDVAVVTPRNASITTNTPIASPSSTPYSQKLVIAKLQEEDSAWAEQIANKLPYLTSAIYTVDSKNASLTVPKNKGHEVMVYLTHIIDNYSQLSDVTIFMHAHQFSWHNNDFLDKDSALMVKRLRIEHVNRNGYMNLRRHLKPGCPDHIQPNNPEEVPGIPEAPVFCESWKQLFPNETVPEVLSQPCCAQFAVSSERIRNKSLDDYVSYRDWLLDIALEDGIWGLIWEYLWKWLFSGQWEYCPEEASCYCEGYGVCFEKDGYVDYFKFSDQASALEKEIDKLKESVNDTVDIPEARVSPMQVGVQLLRQKMEEIKSKAV